MQMQLRTRNTREKILLERNEALMKKTALAGIILFTIALTTAGCGKDMLPNVTTESSMGSISENNASNVIQQQTLIRQYEDKLTSTGLSIEEYISLANLYQGENLIQKQRDILEQCVRLTGDTEAFNLLQEIVVNAQEENAVLNQELSRLNNYIGTDEYLGEAVAILMTDEWAKQMMPKMKQGRRNYYYEDIESGNTLYIEVGYLKDGTFYTKAWRLTTDGKMSYLLKSGPEVRMFICGYQDGKLEGAFTQWICNRETGNIIRMDGNYHENVCVGDFVSKVHAGKGSVDLFALWSSKEQLDYEEYRGSFDDNGFPAVEQPSEKERIGTNPLLAYAFDANRTKYLYVSFDDASELDHFTFQSSAFGMDTIPVFDTYTPVESIVSENGTDIDNTVQEETIQIRVYDSNIEWFNGTNWVVIGSVDEVSRKDPFNLYAEGQVTVDTSEATSKPAIDFASVPSVGEIAKPSTSAPSGNQTTKPKPSTQKPPAQAPTTPTAPTTPSAPATPTAPAAPSTPSTPQEPSTPSTPPSTPSQGEQEIGWSDDML